MYTSCVCDFQEINPASERMRHQSCTSPKCQTVWITKANILWVKSHRAATRAHACCAHPCRVPAFVWHCKRKECNSPVLAWWYSIVVYVLEIDRNWIVVHRATGRESQRHFANDRVSVVHTAYPTTITDDMSMPATIIIDKDWQYLTRTVSS